MDKKGIRAGDPARGRIYIKRSVFETMWKSRIVILFKTGDRVANHNSNTWYIWLYSYLKNERVWIYQSVFLGLIFTFLGLVTAIFIQRLIDYYIPAAQMTKIVYTGALLFLVLVIRASVGFLRERFLIILNRQLSTTINADFIGHLFRLPKRFFDLRRKGDITARIHDIIKIQHFVITLTGINAYRFNDYSEFSAFHLLFLPSDWRHCPFLSSCLYRFVNYPHAAATTQTTGGDEKFCPG